MISKLNGLDAMFLNVDRPHAASHCTMIYIYDQSTVKGQRLGFRDVVRHIGKNASDSSLKPWPGSCALPELGVSGSCLWTPVLLFLHRQLELAKNFEVLGIHLVTPFLRQSESSIQSRTQPICDVPGVALYT